VLGIQVLPVQRPAEIVNYRAMGAAPLVLAGMLTAAAVVALALTLAASVRRRSRDYALLKTLGLVRSQLIAVVIWQASIPVAIGTAAGILPAEGAVRHVTHRHFPSGGLRSGILDPQLPVVGSAVWRGHLVTYIARSRFMLTVMEPGRPRDPSTPPLRSGLLLLDIQRHPIPQVLPPWRLRSMPLSCNTCRSNTTRRHSVPKL
jgi:hypothetical protein